MPVVADVHGWVASGPSYQPLNPSRILDTRDGTGGYGQPIGPGGSIDFTVEGVGGVPASGVRAVVLSLSVTGGTSAGYLTVWPSGEARPATSNINFAANQDTANLVVAKVGAAGRVSIYNPQGSTNVIADVAGWVPTGDVRVTEASWPEGL